MYTGSFRMPPLPRLTVLDSVPNVYEFTDTATRWHWKSQAESVQDFSKYTDGIWQQLLYLLSLIG